MGYVTNRNGRWYADSYEGLDPLTGRDRRRWHRATDEADTRSGPQPSRWSIVPRNTESTRRCSQVSTGNGSTGQSQAIVGVMLTTPGRR